MNRSNKEIAVYQGLGGACLLGFICSVLSSMPSWLNFFHLSSNKPCSLASLNSQIGQKVQVASQIYSDTPQVFSISRNTQKAFLDFSNFEQHSVVIQIQFREFFLDQDHKIAVVPTAETLWQTYYKTFTTNLTLKDSLLRILSLPFHLFRYFLGLRFSNGEISSNTTLNAGENVFVIGTVSLFAGRIEIIPDLVSVSKQAYMALLKSENLKLVWVPLLFLIGTALCYLKVKKIEKNLEEKNNKVIAVIDMKCVICKRNQACIVIQPCNHLCVCDSCNFSSCPICKIEAKNTIKVFSG